MNKEKKLVKFFEEYGYLIIVAVVVALLIGIAFLFRILLEQYLLLR